MRLLLLVITVLSGAAALIYELSWVKLLSLLFGNTTYAVGITVASFMLGLGLGSRVFGWVIDRSKLTPMKWYAVLEFLIAITGLLFPFALRWIENLYLQQAVAQGDPAMLMMIRAALIFSLIVVPTFFMGGTLPVLCKAWVRQASQVGSGVGLLYGLNTVGAVAGTLLSAFYLMPTFGVTGCTRFAVAANGLLCLMAVILSSMKSEDVVSHDESVEDIVMTTLQRRTMRWLCLLFFLTGFLNIAYQIFWTRMLSFFLRSHIYAFASVLAVFLFGLGLGSVAGAALTKWRPMRNAILIVLLWSVGLFGFISLSAVHLQIRNVDVIAGFGSLYPVMDGLMQTYRPDTIYLFAKGLILACAAIMLLPTFLMGMQFPLISSLYISSVDKVGTRVGTLYLANTVGAVLGSLVAGFVMIPAFGMQAGLAIVAGGNLLLALWALLRSDSKAGLKLLVAAVLLASLLPALRWQALQEGISVDALKSFVRLPLVDSIQEPMILKSRIFRHPVLGPNRELKSYEEDVVFSVSVVEDKAGQYRIIYTDNFAATITHDAAKYMRMLGHLPMLLHGSAQDVLVVCLGTGTTAGSVSTYEPRQLDIVDISPAVVRAAGTYFADVNKNVLEQPFTKMHINDGRQFILTSQKTWDVISLEPLLPHTPAAIDFYTKDFYDICRDKLSTGGIMCQWIPVHSMTIENYRIVLKSFVEAFPHVSLWWFDKSSMVIGSMEPLEVDFLQMKSLLQNEAVDHDLKEVHLNDTFSILNSYVAGDQVLKDFCADFKVMTDEHPWIEFTEIHPPKSGTPNEITVMEDFRELKKQSDATTLLVDGSSISSDERNRWDNYKLAAVICYGARIAALQGDLGVAYEKAKKALVFAPLDKVTQALHRQYGSRYFIQAGRQALVNGEMLRSIEKLERAVAIDPASADAHYHLGISLIFASARDEGRGLRELHRAIEINPGYWEAYLNLALTYEHRGGEEEIQEAIAAMKTALTLQPNLLRDQDSKTQLLIMECHQRLVQADGGASSQLPALKRP